MRHLPTSTEAPVSRESEGERAAESTFEKYRAYVNPGLADLLRFIGYGELESRAEGAVVRDSQGREYLDFLASFGVFALGHRPPEVLKAVREQLDRVPLSSKLLLSEPAADLAELLASIAPGGLNRVFFTNSGAEAVEGALKIARAATGRKQIVAAENAFHGKTMGALSASGRPVYKEPFEPLVPGFVHVPFGDAAALERAVTGETAAVILEPIQGEAGVIVPGGDYLPAARRICDGAGALLILDEVQTGLGRTGKMFACEHWGVAPDIM
jgi:putrescine aminotransferase